MPLMVICRRMNMLLLLLHVIHWVLCFVSLEAALSIYPYIYFSSVFISYFSAQFIYSRINRSVDCSRPLNFCYSLVQEMQFLTVNRKVMSSHCQGSFTLYIFYVFLLLWIICTIYNFSCRFFFLLIHAYFISVLCSFTICYDVQLIRVRW